MDKIKLDFTADKENKTGINKARSTGVEKCVGQELNAISLIYGNKSGIMSFLIEKKVEKRGIGGDQDVKLPQRRPLFHLML